MSGYRVQVIAASRGPFPYHLLSRNRLRTFQKLDLTRATIIIEEKIDEIEEIGISILI